MTASADPSPSRVAPPPEWSASDLAANPHAHADKPAKVRGMFAAIAPSYDLNNRLHSFGRDQAWRRAAVRAAALKPTDDVLDAACGTGDLSRAFADAGARTVTGLDFTREMLAIAETKQRALLAARQASSARSAPPPRTITYLQGDALALPFPATSFDIVSIAFGIRNVADPRAAAAEFLRVLRPGGRLVILEFDTPAFAPIRWASAFYTNAIMPRTATLISGDRSGAYRYLPKSVSTFLARKALAQMLRDVGFEAIAQRPLTFGVCVCTTGEKPRATNP
ncbi:bifunctional demethylmenaquinone methyltransferase/2-methoxy-6-polyprenyl-1,4-benzoquinol methylase UbiE [soil metagenome]